VYYYEIWFNGDTTYAKSYAPLSLSVGTFENTTLTATTDNRNPAVGQQFTLSGYLTDANNTPRSGKQIVVVLIDSTGAKTTIGNATTNSSGACQFATSESTQGAFKYELDFYGDNTYAPATTGVIETVGTLTPAVLDLYTTNATPAANQSFTLYGSLFDGVNSTPLSGRVIYLVQTHPTSNNLGTTITNSSGGYSFTLSEPTGNYVYEVGFNGDSNYSAITWTQWIAVGDLKQTSFSFNVSNASPAVDQNFTFSGYLKDANGTPLTAKQIELECEMPGNIWQSMGETQTNSNGYYSFTISEHTAGLYWYECYFHGDSEYAAATAGTRVSVGTLVPTSLSVTASNTNPAVNEQFTLSGYLKEVNGTPLATKLIDLYRQDPSGQITQPTGTYTNATGYYQFSWSESSHGSYRYTVDYVVDQNYAESIAGVTINIGTLQSTTVTAVSNNSNPLISQQFTISGVLKDTNGATLSSKQITIIQQDPTGKWSTVGTTTTSGSGAYTLSLSETIAGPYHYEIWFSGDSAYSSSYAPLSAQVGSL
jgi:protocatechuate 3,4-dioxygenase beta subunit